MGDSTTRPKATRRKYLWLFIILLAIALAWWLWPDSGVKKDGLGFGFGGAQSTPVAVAKLEMGAIDRSISALGTVTAVKTITIRSRVEGTLLALNFNDGQIVKQDDVLAIIDPEPFQIKLDQALGQQAQHKAQMVSAKLDLDRFEKLYKQDSVALQQLDDARARYNELLGQSKSDAAAVEDARLQLEYTKIKAPAAGRLGIRKLDIGNLIRAGDSDGLVVLTQDQPIDVVFSITQSNLPELLSKYNSESALQVQLYDRSNTEVVATGELKAIDNQIDTATGTVQLKARFSNSDRSLFPNQFVQVRLLLGEQTGLIVPLRAIQMGSSGEYVYRVDAEDEVSMAPVTSLVDDGVNAVVKTDLEAGDRVVVQGTDRLRTGSKVEIIED